MPEIVEEIQDLDQVTFPTMVDFENIKKRIIDNLSDEKIVNGDQTGEIHTLIKNRIIGEVLTTQNPELCNETVCNLRHKNQDLTVYFLYVKSDQPIQYRTRIH